MKKLIALTALIALGSITASAQVRHKNIEKSYDSIITNTVIIKTKDGRQNTQRPTNFLPTTFVECSLDGYVLQSEGIRRNGREPEVYTNATLYIGASTVIRTAGESTRSRWISNSIYGNSLQYYMQGLDSSQQEEHASKKAAQDESKKNVIDGICIIAEKVDGDGVDSLVLTNATYYIGENTVFETRGRSVMMLRQSNSLVYKAASDFMENRVPSNLLDFTRYMERGSSIDTKSRYEALQEYMKGEASTNAEVSEFLKDNIAPKTEEQRIDSIVRAEVEMSEARDMAVAMEFIKGNTPTNAEGIELIQDGISVNLPGPEAIMREMRREQDKNPSITNFYRYDDNDSLTVMSMKIGRGNKNVRVIDMEYVELITIGDFQRGYYRRTDPKKLPIKRNYKTEKRVGFDLGVALHYNGLIENLSKMTLPDDTKYMNLNAKSIGVDLSFFEAKIMKCGPVSLRTGLQMEINNFRFENNIGLKKDPAGNIVVDNSYTERGIDIQKSKLTTVYLNVPLQVRLNVGQSNMWLSAGGVMGLLIQSHTKVKTNELGKEKSRNDNNVRNFHYGLQAAVGYSEYALTVRYYPHGIFRSGQGPAVQQINVSLGCRL